MLDIVIQKCNTLYMSNVTKVFTIRFTLKELSFISRALAKMVDEDGFIQSEAMALLTKLVKIVGKS